MSYHPNMPALMAKSPSQTSSASGSGSATGTGSGRTSPIRSHLTRIFSQIEIGTMRFVILDCPTDTTLPDYLRELQARGVTDVVRVCEPTYETVLLRENAITVHDWPFKDGGVPPAKILQDFLTLCDARFGGISLSTSANAASRKTPMPCIAVHCVAGLGRAPVLVAVSLIEAGMKPLDAVEFVRKYRRGAFNSAQLQYLVDNYRRSYNKRPSPLASFLGVKRSSSAATVSSSLGSSASIATSGSGSGSTVMNGTGSTSLVVSLSAPATFPNVSVAGGNAAACRDMGGHSNSTLTLGFDNAVTAKSMRPAMYPILSKSGMQSVHVPPVPSAPASTGSSLRESIARVFRVRRAQPFIRSSGESESTMPVLAAQLPPVNS